MRSYSSSPHAARFAGLAWGFKMPGRKIERKEAGEKCCQQRRDGEVDSKIGIERNINIFDLHFSLNLLGGYAILALFKFEPDD